MIGSLNPYRSRFANAIAHDQVECLVQTVPAAGCELTDMSCICANDEVMLASAACLQRSCTIIEALSQYQSEDSSGWSVC